jgi:hypothetical protein
MKLSGTSKSLSGRYQSQIKGKATSNGTFELEVDGAYARDQAIEARPSGPIKARTLPLSKKTGSALGRWRSMKEDSKRFKVLNRFGSISYNKSRRRHWKTFAYGNEQPLDVICKSNPKYHALLPSRMKITLTFHVLDLRQLNHHLTRSIQPIPIPRDS